MPPPDSPDPFDFAPVLENAFAAAGKAIGRIERATDFASERRGRLAVADSLRKSAVKLLRLTEQGDNAATLLVVAGRLEEEARTMPDPREAITLKVLAQAFIEVHRRMGHRVRLTTDGPDVQRFARVCRRAGVVLSEERFRGALSQATNSREIAPAAQNVVDIVDEAMRWALARVIGEAG